MEVYNPGEKNAGAGREYGLEMLNSKKSCPPVSTTEGQQTEGHTNGCPLQKQVQYSKQNGPAQGLFATILHKGAENGQTTDELRRMLGVSETRVIRHLIAQERAAGAVILSGITGYYLPDDGEKGRQEAAAFVASITAKGISTLRAADSAKEFLDRLPGQLEIGGGAGGTKESSGKL